MDKQPDQLKKLPVPFVSIDAAYKRFLICRACELRDELFCSKSKQPIIAHALTEDCPARRMELYPIVLKVGDDFKRKRRSLWSRLWWRIHYNAYVITAKKIFGALTNACNAPFETIVERRSHCIVCPHRQRGVVDRCEICTCAIPLKTKLAGEGCPDGRWKPVEPADKCAGFIARLYRTTGKGCGGCAKRAAERKREAAERRRKAGIKEPGSVSPVSGD